MRQRRRHAFRPGTTSNHRTQAAAFIAFCTRHGLRDIHPTPQTVCWYLEHLTATIRSPRTIRNYVSGLRTWHRRVAGDPHALDSTEVKQMLRALDMTLVHTPSPKLPITQDMLPSLLQACNSLGAVGPAVKVALLLGYYGFLRQSNLAPRTPASFDPKRDTCRGDVLFQPPGLIVILKWSKTLQRGEKAHLVPLPARPNHPLCPLAAYQALLHHTPTLSPNHPLLQVPAPPGAPLSARCVTTGQLAQGLHTALLAAGHQPSDYSLHSLRAGGATDAHRAGAQPQDIQRHGDWASSCFWGYVAAHPTATAPIPRALSRP